ncbi:MAG: cell division protein FtsI (penicillin-binding protein 3) [Bacteroidia bacterium]
MILTTQLMNVKKDILWRVLVSIFMLVLLGIGIVSSTIRIQFTEGEKWRNMSDSLYVMYKKVPAIRGSVYADNGSLLATSIPIYQVSIDFKVIHKLHRDSFNRCRPEIAENLASTLQNHNTLYFDSLLKDGFAKRLQYVTVSRNASYLQVRQLGALPIFKSGRYKGGIMLEERTIRKKPYDELLARTIGYVNENWVGAGIEASFNTELKGVDGKMLVRKISGGYKPIDDEVSIKPSNGKDIYTTININLQDIVNEALIEGVRTHGAEYGTAILLDVKTGQIKALANINQTSKGYIESFNHAIGTKYEPGSTIKLLSTMAILEETDIKPEDSINIYSGSYQFFGKDLITDHGGHNPVKRTLRDVFVQSSNVGISTTIYNSFKSNPEKYVNYFDKLHLTQPLKTGIKGEAIPHLTRPGNPDWSGMSLPSLSIGYAFSTSALHMAMLYNAVANDGVMMQPYLIESVGYLGKIEEQYEPIILNKKICSDRTLEHLQSFMLGVVDEGTAKLLSDLPFRVAGKTGTSKVVGPNGYIAGQYYSSFAGYFPAEAPKYTLLVMIAKAKTGGYAGGTVAAPVFKEIARKVYASVLKKRVYANDTIQLPQLFSGRWKNVKRSLKHLDINFSSGGMQAENLVQMHPQNGELFPSKIALTAGAMPNLIGLSARDALFEMENRGYKVKLSGYGKIVEQSPEPGVALRPGRTVYIRMFVE